uniref:Serpentine receptor class gamma n=1 Tax=Meloidogyne floridensis TaxID=298350 RepID=A0A915NDY2_9BILA
MGFFLSAPIVFLANTVYLPFVISVVVGVPSAILYLFEVVIIITKWKEFNSSFFQLLIAKSILNILNFIISFVPRFGKVGLFTNLFLQLPSWVLAVIFFFGYYCIHGENIATTLQLLNRLSSILWPFSYERAWRRWLPLSMLLIFVLPLSRTVQILSEDFIARLQADNQTVTIYESTIKPGEINPTADAAYSCVIFMFICLIINIATLFVYKTKVQPQTNKTTSNGLQRVIEKRLTLYTFWTFVGQLLISTSTTLIYIAVMISIRGTALLSYDECQNFFLAVFNQNFLVSDISTIVLPSWLLLWANELTKKHLFGKIIAVKNLFKNGNPIQTNSSMYPTNS